MRFGDFVIVQNKNGRQMSLPPVWFM